MSFTRAVASCMAGGPSFLTAYRTTPRRSPRFRLIKSWLQWNSVVATQSILVPRDISLLANGVSIWRTAQAERPQACRNLAVQLHLFGGFRAPSNQRIGKPRPGQESWKWGRAVWLSQIFFCFGSAAIQLLERHGALGSSEQSGEFGPDLLQSTAVVLIGTFSLVSSPVSPPA